MYALLRAIAGIALRWYYSDVQIEGSERIPRDRPLLLTVNHPNALVDALLVGWIMPRRVLITAKATLFAHPLADRALRWLGVVPLRRASDERIAGAVAPSAERNTQTFEAVNRALARGGCVLIFPEGRTPDEPSLAPLKTGAARMALHAVESAAVPELAILPIGLVFERKEKPRSRVLATVGQPIVVRDWIAASRETVARTSPVDALTREIEASLRALTLSYATLDEAARGMRLARAIASILDDAPAIGVVDRRFGIEARIARRIDELGASLASADAALRARAERLVADIERLMADTSRAGLSLEDVQIDLAVTPATRFVAREGWYFAVGGPIAAWGWLNHWLPLRLARAIAMRNVASAADPAMRTIVAGSALVTLAYLAQTIAVGSLLGWEAGVAYLVSLPLAADVNFALADRMRRARRRARAFLRLRAHPRVQALLRERLLALRAEALELDRALGTADRSAAQ